MMKKVMFVVVMLLVASACFAQLQSPPSNLVGYVKFTAGGTGVNPHTPFGLPFVFWDVVSGTPQYGVVSNNPSDILGDQPNCAGTLAADRIIRQDNGNPAYRSTTVGCGWTGALEGGLMTAGRAYWYLNKTGADRPIVLAGQVDNSGNYATIQMTEGNYTPYSWRDSRQVDRDDLNLLAAGFLGGNTSILSDQVLSQNTGLFFWRDTNPVQWDGSLLNLEPGHAYWVFNRNHANDTWSYNYDASGASLSVGTPPTMKDNGATISKMDNGTVKTKTKAGTTRE
jgi:hypothetical protein